MIFTCLFFPFSSWAIDLGRTFPQANADVLFDAASRVHWEQTTPEALQSMVAVGAAVAVRLEDAILRRQISYLDKVFTVTYHVARLQAWRDAGMGSEDKLALTKDSAQLLADLDAACTRLQDFSAGVCATAGVNDLGEALLAVVPEHADEFHIYGTFDRWPISQISIRCKNIATAVRAEIVDRCRVPLWGHSPQLLVAGPFLLRGGC